MNSDLPHQGKTEYPKNQFHWIKTGDNTIALIIKSSMSPEQTTFLTPDTYTQQAGFIVYPAGGKITPHKHIKIERKITGTSEALIVRKGKMVASFFDEDRNFVESRTLEQGDVVFLISGGHGFQMIEDTILLEIKQGPYTGNSEKERFNDPR